jgi:hypothetical protein
MPPQLRPCMVSILLAHRKIWNLRSDYTRAQAMSEKGITRITNLLLLTPEENLVYIVGEKSQTSQTYHSRP